MRSQDRTAVRQAGRAASASAGTQVDQQAAEVAEHFPAGGAVQVGVGFDDGKGSIHKGISELR